MAAIPTIETERLRLRPMTLDDWPAFQELMCSDRAAYMGGPYSKQGAWGWFCHDIAQWMLFGHGGLMIEDRQTGHTLGQVGINFGPLFSEHELGWFLYPEAEGKGYAFEAAQACRDWAFAELGLTTLVSFMARENVRSRKLAERLGAVLDPNISVGDPEDLVYRHPHPGTGRSSG